MLRKLEISSVCKFLCIKTYNFSNENELYFCSKIQKSKFYVEREQECMKLNHGQNRYHYLFHSQKWTSNDLYLYHFLGKPILSASASLTSACWQTKTGFLVFGHTWNNSNIYLHLLMLLGVDQFPTTQPLWSKDEYIGDSHIFDVSQIYVLLFM